MYWLPILFAGRRVRILLAQEANVVGALEQRIDVGRIGPEFLVVHPDPADVLLAAMHRLDFAVALNLFGNPGQGDGQRDRQQSHQEDDRNQHIALLGGLGTADWGGFHLLAPSL